MFINKSWSVILRYSWRMKNNWILETLDDDFRTSQLVRFHYCVIINVLFSWTSWQILFVMANHALPYLFGGYHFHFQHLRKNIPKLRDQLRLPFDFTKKLDFNKTGISSSRINLRYRHAFN